ncbi:MAG: hypothetical protein U0R65_07830 [Candidatus Nanopelagicales bacterium]
MDTTGTGTASAWISSNPPPYGAHPGHALQEGRAGLCPLDGVAGHQRSGRLPHDGVRDRDAGRPHPARRDRRFDVAVPVTFAP